MSPTLSVDRRLAELGADLDLARWMQVYPDLGTAWTACPRGDWLLWMAAILAPDATAQRAVVAAAAACARLALPYATRQMPGPQSAIEAAESWAQGLASAAVVDAAAHGAAFAVMGSPKDDRAWAAASAAWAAAWAAVWFERYDGPSIGAAQAARQAAEAAAEAHAPDARAAVLARCAEIVREQVPCPALPAHTARKDPPAA